VGRFFTWTARGGVQRRFRLVPTAANGQPACAFYIRSPGDVWRAHSIQVLDLDRDAIAVMTSFVTPALFPLFGLPAELPNEDR
jgi:RNA polymerase sigma-70 factor (ECF subfamily)